MATYWSQVWLLVLATLVVGVYSETCTYKIVPMSKGKEDGVRVAVNSTFDECKALCTAAPTCQATYFNNWSGVCYFANSTQMVTSMNYTFSIKNCSQDTTTDSVTSTVKPTTTVPPVCKPDQVYVSYNKTVQALNDNIYCFNKENTSLDAANICQHSTGVLQYITTNKPAYLDLVDSANTTCITLNTLVLTDSEICVAFTAQVNSDTRIETSVNPATICIVFNSDGPAITPGQSKAFNYGVAALNVDLNLEVNSLDGISGLQITGTTNLQTTTQAGITTTASPGGVINVIVKSVNPPILTLTITPSPDITPEVIVTFNVTDDGNPKKASTGNLTLLFDKIECESLAPIAFNLETIQQDTKLGQINCSALNGNVTYVYTDNNSVLKVDDFGEILYHKPNGVTVTGSVNIQTSVLVSSTSGVSINFPIIASGGASPVFLNAPYSLTVNETQAVGTCYNGLISVENPTQENLTLNVTNGGNEVNFTYGNSGNTTLCLVSTLLSSTRQDHTKIYTITASNWFGSSNTTLTVDVKVKLNPPILTFGQNSFEVRDIASVGTVITTFQVTPEIGVTLDIKEPNQPFEFNNNQIVVSEVLPRLEQDSNSSSYQLTVQAINADGTTEKEITVVVLANKSPTFFSSTYQLPIPVNDVGPVVNVYASDPDNDDITFSFHPSTPAYITDHFSLVQARSGPNQTFTLSTIKPLYQTNLTLAQLQGINIVIVATDAYNASGTVKVYLNGIDQPRCGTPLRVSLPETFNSNCFNVTSTCNSTLNNVGVQLEYSFNFTYSNSGLSFSLSNFTSMAHHEYPTVEVCGVFVGILTVGLYQISPVTVLDRFGTVNGSLELTVTEVNQHPPVFVGIANNAATIQLPEDTALGSTVYTFNVIDADGGDAGKFQLDVQGLRPVFSINSTDNKTYSLRLDQPLDNAGVTSYELNFTATDTGGLLSYFVLTVNVNEVNSPPICNTTQSFSVSVLEAVGYSIGVMQCIDNDVKPEFKQIQYRLDGIGLLPIAINNKGNITVTGSLLGLTDTVKFVVEASSLNKTTLVNVSLSISNNFPPVCNATTISTIFQETATGCSVEKIRCTNELSTAMTWTIVNGYQDDLEVQIENDTAKELDIRMCLNGANKKQILNDTVQVKVRNDLGFVDIIWNVDIQDVNEAPSFNKDLYNYNVDETASNGNVLTTISVGNRLPNGGVDDDRIYLVDPDIADGFNVKTIGATGAVIDKINNVELPGVQLPINYGGMKFTVVGKLQPKYIYRFVIQAEDGGNLTTFTTVNFNIVDINEAPRCSPNQTVLPLNLLQKQQEILYTIQNCQDPDFQSTLNTLSYSIPQTQDIFDINERTGVIFLKKRLPREKPQHVLKILVKDGGGLDTTFTATFNIDRNVGADCNPVKTPPSVWLKNECILYESNCVDPTTDNKTTLTYTVSGNYLPDFYVSGGRNGSKGDLQLCYNKTINGNYQVNIRVNNGLKVISLEFNITVRYEQSVPQFASTSYFQTVPENFAAGGVIIGLTATSSGNFAGEVTYSIKETDPVEALSYFTVDSTKGIISSTKSLRDYSNQEIKITFEATDSRSGLSSSVVVTVPVSDINERPTCVDEKPLKIKVDASVTIGYSLHTFNCSDPDVKDEFKQITTSLSGSSNFILDGQEIKTSAQLPVTSSPIDLMFTVSDGTLSLQINVTITISFEPSSPTLNIGPVTTSSIELYWSYTRSEAVLFITKHILERNDGTGLSIYRTVPNTKLSYIYDNLQPNTVYSFRLVAETSSKNLTTPFIAITTREIPILTGVMIGFKVTNRDWSDSMVNNQSADYLQLKSEVEENFMSRLSDDKALHGIKIINMRPGSVIFDGVMYVNQTGPVLGTVTSFLDAVYTGNLGNLTVDTGSGVVFYGDQYISSPSLNLASGSPDNLLEGTVVKYVCGFRLVSVSGVVKPVVQWFLDDYQLILTHTPRIKMSNTTRPTDKFGYVYNLEFDKAIPSHSGNLRCRISSSKNTSVTESASTLVRIISKPVVTLWPLSSFVKGGESQKLTCTSELASSLTATYSWFDANTNTQIPQATSAEYTVAIIDKDLRMYCKVSNAAGTSQSQVAVVHHVPSAGHELSCASSVDTRKTTWPEGKTGTAVNLECGDGYVGYAQRFCTESGQWKTPDYSNCQKTNLVMLKRETDDVKEGKLVSSPEQALVTLVSLTQDGYKFSAGDVELAVQILMDVVDINNDDVDKVIMKDELQNFASSASNVLNADDEEWITLADQGKSGIAVMIDTIDAMAKLTSARLNHSAPVTATTDKMVIEVGRSKVNDIKFPRAGGSYPSWIDGTNNEILLQKSALQKFFTDDKEFGYNVVYYNEINNIVDGNVVNPGQTIGDNMTDLDINSKILAFSVNPPPDKLDPEIYLTFQHTSDNYSNPQCVFLDLKPPFDKIGRWSTEGCTTELTSDPNITICKCNHLTNFAILMSPGKTPVRHIEALTYISIIGCGISLLCLVLTIGVYSYLWRYVKSDKSIILLNLCVTLIISYALFLGGVKQVQIKAVCQTIAALLHFFYLVVFFLMLAEGVEVFISVVYVFATKSRLKWILLASWGIPAIIVGISLGVTRLEGYGNDDFCWLSLDSGLLWAFVGPALCVIFINLLIMIKVLTVMFSTTTMVTKTMKQKGRTGLKAVCVLLPIMGLTWVFGVFSVNEETVVFEYLFAIFNSLQGVLIFIFHCLMCRQVQDGFRMKRRRYRAKSIDTGTKSLTNMPLNTSQTRSTSETDKPTNDLDKSNSPFLQVDRQVQELAQKLAKVDNNNIKNNANKVNIPPKSDFTIFDNIPESSEKQPESQQDLLAVSNRRKSESRKNEAFRDAELSKHPSSRGSSSSGAQSARKPSSSDQPGEYDKLRSSSREEPGVRDYTKLDNRVNDGFTRGDNRDGFTRGDNRPVSQNEDLYGGYGAAAQIIQRKMPSIEDNSLQQAGYLPDPAVYVKQNISESRREQTPPRRQEVVKPSVAPPVAPKTKPKPKRDDDNDENKIQNIENAYEAVDAYYIGPQYSAAPKEQFQSKSKKSKSPSRSNPNLNQPIYVDNYPPTDKWAQIKESKMKKPSQYRDVPASRRIQSHEDISGYRNQSYQPLGGVQILHDSRGRPVSRPAPDYHRGWPDSGRGYGNMYNQRSNRR